MAFTRTWDGTYESQPAGSENVNQGDDRIRNFKTDIRERFAIEHDLGTAGTETARHKFASGNKATRDAIADLVNGMIFFRTDRAGLDQRLAGAFVQRYFYDLLTTALRMALTNVDKGYLVFDTDEGEFYHGDGAAGWTRVNGKVLYQRATGTTTNQSPAANDTWEDITGATITVVTPNDGYDYQIAVMASVKFRQNATQPCGFRLLEDATVRDVEAKRYTGGLPVQDDASLNWVKTDPVAGTSYVFKLQMLAAGSSANLDVNPDAESLAGTNPVNSSSILTILQRRDI